MALGPQRYIPDGATVLLSTKVIQPKIHIALCEDSAKDRTVVLYDT